jgi:hypothetical protein
MPTLGLEAGVVATIIVDPQAEKNRGDEEAVDDRGGNEVHGSGGRRIKGRTARWADRDVSWTIQRSVLYLKSKSAVPAERTAP